MIRSRALLACLPFLATGCGGQGEAPGGRVAETPPDPAAAGTTGVTGPGEPRTFVFHCPGRPDLVVRLERGQAVVFAPDGTRFLPRVPSASGERYSDEVDTFWAKGEEALFELGGESWPGCRNDRAAAIWEHAKLSGADFRAVGNEPGWVLVMYPDRWTLEIGYGETRIEMPSGPPVENPARSRTVWESEGGGRRLRVTAELGPCQDSMADAVYETSVTVELDGTVYRGCGRPLH